MARKKYSCDFETSTKLDDCRVWAYGWMEIGNKKNYQMGTSITDFMSWCEKSQGDLYFHNLSFDGSFIVNWLLNNGFRWEKTGLPKTFSTVISNMGQWYIIDICYGYKGKKKLHTVIYDSKKKLPFSVKKIAKDFHLEIQKGDIDYHAERPIGHELTEEEKGYLKNDIEIIADALQIQFDQGLNMITSGSDSLKGFKASITSKMFEKLFPILDLKFDKELRHAYRGGFTWVNEIFQTRKIGEGIVFDVNSLYPSVMYYKPLPYGMPIAYKGKYEQDEQYPLYIQHIRCEFDLKEGKIPCIQIKKNLMFKQNEYLKDSGGEIVDLHLTNIDLELIEEHYDLYDVEYIEGWKFRQKIGIFNQFIDKWMYIKTHSKGAIKILAKLMLNSLYGKFGTNPKITGKIPYLKGNGANGFELPKDDNGKVIDEYKDPIYIPMGIFITSWARQITISTAQKCYSRIIYCDTDSIHLTGTDIPEVIKDMVDPDKLGFWKHESTFKRAKFIRQKTYVEDVYGKMVWDEKEGKEKFKECGKDEATTTRLNVKCSGMTDSIKEKVTFENFEVGFSSFGKLLPKQVKGGVVLVDTEFTIK